MKRFKTYLITLGLLLLLVSQDSFSQGKVEVVKSLETFGSATLEYRQNQQEIKDIDGSPYMQEDFKDGQVLMGGTLYGGISLRYNIYSDRFEAHLKDQTIELDPVKNRIDTIYYLDQKFVRRFLLDEKGKSLSYMSMLGKDGRNVLYKRYKISFTPAREAEAYKGAIPAKLSLVQPDYYLDNDEKQILIKGAKSLSNFYGVDVKEVKSYLKSGKLKIKDEEDLKKACAHFSLQVLD